MVVFDKQNYFAQMDSEWSGAMKAINKGLKSPNRQLVWEQMWSLVKFVLKAST